MPFGDFGGLTAKVKWARECRMHPVFLNVGQKASHRQVPSQLAPGALVADGDDLLYLVVLYRLYGLAVPVKVD
jgi:hypothetical protein